MNIQSQLVSVDAFLCTIGGRVSIGEEAFVTTELEYPTLFAKIALENNAKHFGFLSGGLASPTSWFLLFKTKGRAENAINNLNQRGLTIYRPGLLTNRRNDERTLEKILAVIPFMVKISSRDMG